MKQMRQNCQVASAAKGMNERTRKIDIALMGLITIAMCLLLLPKFGIIDDGYIYLTVCKRLLNGDGFSFHRDVLVEANTSFLWPLLVAGLSLLGPTLENAAIALGLASTLGTLAIAIVLVNRSSANRIARWLVFGSILSWPYWISWGMSGLESSLFAFGIALFCLLLQGDLESGRPRTATYAVASLLPLIRPEGLLLSLLAIVVGFKLQRSVLALIPLLGIAALTVFRIAYYGYPLPNTYYAKQIPELASLARFSGQYLVSIVRDSAPLALTIVVLAAAVPFQKESFRKSLGFALPAAMLFLASIAVGGDHFLGARFLLPLVVPVAMCCLSVMLYANQGLFGRYVIPFLMIASIAINAGYNVLFLDRSRRELETTRRWIVAGQLLSRAPRDMTLASIPVGALSFYSDLHLLDLVGLAEIDIAHRGQFNPNAAIGHTKSFTEYVVRRKPNLIYQQNLEGAAVVSKPAWPIILPSDRYGVAMRQLLESPEVIKDYVPCIIWGKEAILLVVRRSDVPRLKSVFHDQIAFGR